MGGWNPVHGTLRNPYDSPQLYLLLILEFNPFASTAPNIHPDLSLEILTHTHTETFLHFAGFRRIRNPFSECRGKKIAKKMAEKFKNQAV